MSTWKWKNNRQWARSAAERIIRTQNLNETPVNPVKVARWLGLRVEFSPNLAPDVHGTWEYHPGCSIIVANAMNSRRQTRFAVAHEIGHYLRQSPESSCDAEEFCCNEFAAALLMPDRWFWEDVCLGYTDQELSAMYDLSVSAVRVRRAEMINVHR